ncbi:MAG TPA: hypothetical protein VGC78_00880 [Gaiellaceae bacterium]
MRSRRVLWLWRVLLLGFALAYLASPRLQLWISPWPPFLAAALVEAQFFVASMRGPRGRVRPSDAGPQPRDLEELGWPSDDGDDLAPPPPARGRPRRGWSRLLQALAVVVVLGAALLLDRRNDHWRHLPGSTRSATASMLGREASRIAGHRATVVCDTAGHHVGSIQDADGLAEVGGRRAWLTPSICYQLYRVEHTKRAHGIASGRAIAVLAHEAWHLRGEASEGRANCFAYQSGVGVGEHLGLAATTARELMRVQLAENPSAFADAPAYVVPRGCRRGGSLDLHLDGRFFP